jgi:hypothetical protein
MRTAVEWLIEKHFGSIENCSPNFRKHIEQANKIFEEQIKEAWIDGVTNWDSEKEAQQYYNETFKSEQCK